MAIITTTRLDAAVLKTHHSRSKIQTVFCPNDILQGTTKCETASLKYDKKGKTTGCRKKTCKRCWGVKYEIK